MAGIAWYQKKIGAYDQQIWEKSLEQTELKGFGSKPKRTGHIKPDLIDVDLVRVAGAVLYFEVPAACASEVVGPLCLMLLLGTVHCQIVSTESSRSPDNSPFPSRSASPVRRKRQRKSRKSKRSDDESSRGGGIIEPNTWQPEDNHRLHRSEKRLNSPRRPLYGASEDLSSEEEADEAELQKERLFSSAPPKYARALRNRLHNVPKKNLPSQIQGDGNGEPADPPMLPREVELLRPSEGSRPASDTDDMLWEELLQDPDSASTGSSESEEEEPHSHNHSIPLPNISLTRNVLNLTHSHAGLRHQFSWLQACHPSKDRVSAIIWEQGECKKADMSVLEISGIILSRVKVVEQGMGYLIFGSLVTATLALLPFCFRLVQKLDVGNINLVSLEELPAMVIGPPCASSCAFFIITALERLFLSGLFFFMMCVAERTYKQRLLFAKLFSHLTSARKAKKSEIPHFRLKKVQNIKMWLSLRSFLKRRGPQRSVDVIVSSIFLLALSISFIICAQLLHSHHTFLDSETNWELMVWCAALMVFLLRLATLGAETNRKYSNASVLLTEQELDTPFRLLGLTVNPLIYNITRVVILSAISAAVSDLLGFNIRVSRTFVL
ncbi:Protein PHTF1 [Labeo rohita]|uniref:Protein PHTF1 n=1 Tax=Labeo rohita TaxID=84645 RepID=A0ABQ8M8Y4_LABRO|nr:Protein PHTF1 [Labeo rohita]